MNRVTFAGSIVLLLGLIVNVGESAVNSQEQVKASLDHYFQSWNEPDEAKRLAHLEAGWAQGATYTDPSAHVEGRDALSKHIAGFLANPQLKGFSIVRVTGIDIHHGSFRFGWEMRTPDGKVATVGIDYGEFDANGMITKIVGFFGPMPELKE